MKPISSKPPFSVSSSSLSQFRIFISHFSTSSFPPYRRHEEELRNVRVSVWWDFENCNLPAGVNVFKVAHAITGAIRAHGIKGPITITAFGDVLQLSRTNQEALSATGINIAHVPNGGKNSADRSLLVDLMYWVSQNPPPAHLFLISGDRDFASILHRLRMKNYNILLASPETAPNILCSAASIMWHWNSLVRGENLTGKHFNQPPDGPYGSWYGHYKVPLEDPFSVVEQPAARSSCTDEVCDPASDSKPGPIPRAVMRQISQILNSYPRGISMTELRAELNKGYAGLDRDLYGYKKFSRFLLAMPHILKLLPGSDGQFFVRAITPKAPELFESSLGTSNGHVGRNGYQDLSKPLKLNGEESHKDEAVNGKSILPSSPEVKAEDPSRKIQQAPELSEKVVRMEMKEPLKKKPQPTPTEEKVSMPAGVQETEGNLSPVEEQDSSSEVGFFRKNWCRWFGGKDGVSEIKSQNIPEKCSDSGDISERTSHNYPEKSCISSDKL
ncbi:hypothetical protein Pint_27109 [Pistacia integerrima]|uniref:Uncharacterized protein n=1 Tax=Pistacia integerrima TaxID=434235 RepID=A0ACC0YQD0_9ROSI|nr:hypothetical protein Pint_27109 [Pistacia integerrima]